jgi:integrase
VLLRSTGSTHHKGAIDVGIYRRGKVYWARWGDGGTQQRRSLGTTSWQEAKRRFAEIQPEPPRATTARKVPKGLTVREILKLWFEYQKARCKPRSLCTYKIVKKRFSMVWGDLQPAELTTVRVEEFQETGLQIGLSPRTINNQMGLALSAIRWAHERELIDTGPPKYRALKLKSTHSRKYLTGTEIVDLLRTLQERRWKRLEIVVMLALYAGLRQHEIIWLTWEDVDLVEGWLHVRAKQGWSPKSASSERSIPIADELHSYLSAQPITCKWVAPRVPGSQWQQRHFNMENRKLFKAAGVDDGGPHTLHRLRGTFATTVLRGGGDLESLREVLGHQKISVTAVYLASTSESKRRAVQGVSFAEHPA